MDRALLGRGLVFLGVLAAAAAALVVVLWLVQRRLIYLPMVHDVPPAGAVLPRAEDVRLATADGLSLGAWWVPADRTPSLATVLVFNGNAGHRGFRAELAAKLAAAGLDVLLFDYRGYGGNPGRPSEDGLIADARAARAYLAARPDVHGDRIVYFGESLGGGVAVALAVEIPPAALVLRSPFTSLVDVARRHYPLLPVGVLLRDRYPSIERISRLASPVLIIAGDRDRIVPARLSRRLFEAAGEPKRWFVVEGAGHNDAELFGGDAVVDATVDFVRRHVGED